MTKRKQNFLYFKQAFSSVKTKFFIFYKANEKNTYDLPLLFMNYEIECTRDRRYFLRV
jgi:hypothetical protein